MALSWTGAQAAAFRDGSLDFSWALRGHREPPLGPDLYEPIFVRLRGQTKAALRNARRDLRDAANDPAAPLLMEPHELAVLSARCHNGPDPDNGLPDEYPLYRALGTPDATYAALFELLDTGFPVALAPGASPAPVPLGPAPAATGQPIVALIDDGIGFLNARFRKGAATRFHAVWLQALESGSAAQMHLGRVLGRAEIDALLAPGQDEGAAYAAINAGLIRDDAHRSSEHASSHGTHMLDLAAGADPEDGTDPARDWPLLAVQLPPQAVADTSGSRFESYMVQAMRWILRRAHEIDPAAPVIVNLSMGMLAGPKDGTRFAEFQIAREAAFWESVKGQPVRVVWSFGNDYESRLVEQVDYPQVAIRSATDRTLSWVVQPGDQTESFLELHCEAGQSLAGLQIALETPDGNDSGFAALAPGETRGLMAGSAAAARIYHVPAQPLSPGTERRAHYVLALAPTETHRGGPVAPAGTWTLRCRYPDGAALTLHLQIQRDVSLVGYRAQARQSYFDDASAYGWDPVTQDHTALQPDGPVTYAASHNALASASGRQVFTAGAAWFDAERQVWRPSDYTAQGSGWSVPGPTVATRADRSRLRTGVMATGTHSSSVGFIGGTSAAAAQLSRALALSAARISANAQQGGGTQLDDFDWSRLVSTPVPGEEARLGACVVTPAE